MSTRMSSIAAITGLALASTAFAQNYSLDIVARSIVDASIQSSFEISVVANGPGTHALSAAFNVDGNDANVTIAGMTWTPAGWTTSGEDNGWLGGGDYAKVVAGQTVLPGVPGLGTPNPDSSLPDALIGTFTIDLTGTAGVIDLQLVQTAVTLVIFDTGINFFTDDTQGTLTLGSASIQVVPAPASIAMLGLGGLVATRRRR